MKDTIHLTLLSFFILTLISCGNKDDGSCPDGTCDDFATQSEAQAAFKSDPECWGKLDNDNDGIACEQYFTGSTGGSTSGSGQTGGTSGCPTTANCGCSNKNKDACASSCCKWVVGSGCQCK